MSENIADYGGIKNDDSRSAATANIAAINDASEAASDNTVYLPEGTWYIGPPEDKWGGFALWAGTDGNRGAAGLSFVGDGPNKSILRWAWIKDGHGNSIRYFDNVNHGDVTWKDMTYDGNYQNLSFGTGDTYQKGITITTADSLTLQNVRLENFEFWGVSANIPTVDVDQCTFRDIGFGHANRTGNAHSHPLLTSTDTDMTVSDTEFVLIVGSCVDYQDSSAGTLVMEDIYAEGIGVNLIKINDAGAVELRRINYTARTQELVNKFNRDGEQEFNGGYFIRRISGNKEAAVPVTMQNIKARSLYRGFVRNDSVNDFPLNLDLKGGDIGPIVVDDVHNNGVGAVEYLNDCELNWDVQDMSITNVDYSSLFAGVDGGVQSGTIDTLRWDSEVSLGDLSGLTINTKQNGDPFTPDVPTQSEVGVNSGDDATPAVSLASPTDGDTVSGTVTVQADASDQEDGSGSLTVEYRIDDGSWSQAGYNSDTGYYEADWDTTALADGSHTLGARATDSAGQTATTSITVTVDNAGPLFDEWTPRWDSVEGDWEVVNGSSFDGEFALVFDPQENEINRYALSWDTVGTPADVEVLDRFRVTESLQTDWSANARVHVRSGADPSSGSGWNNGENGYFMDIGHLEGESAPAFRVGKYTDGDLTIFQRFGNPQSGTSYYRRFRVDGTELKAKVWPVEDSEPAEWDVTLTDSDHSEGWAGLGSFRPELVETDVCSVATGGASAEYSGLEAEPSVSWASPTGDGTVSETVTLQIDASDRHDDAGTLTVEYRIDDGSWSEAEYNSDTGYHEADWDTTALADGSHTLGARATDSAGNTATATVNVTTANDPVIEQFDVTDMTDSDRTSYDVAWSVSDNGGDLDRIITTLKYQDMTVTAESTAISGNTASGTHTLRVQGDVDEISLFVNDDNNRTAATNKSV